MADLLEKASAWLQDQRARFLSRTVLYQRGTESVELAATIGRTTFEQADEFGIVHRHESRDYIVQASDLAFLPRAGDRIREQVGDQTFVYEVMAPKQTGECPWRFSDAYRRTLRIHTKLIATGGVSAPG